MAEIILKNNRKGNPRIDLTPMVDLGFLLITFFIFTTTLNEPRTMDIQMPIEGKPTPIAHHTAMTIFLGNHHQLYYYTGEDAMNNQYEQLKLVTATSIRTALVQHAQEVKEAFASGTKGSTKHDIPFVIIKASASSQYTDLISLLDELAISNISNYALLDITPEEENVILQKSFLKS